MEGKEQRVEITILKENNEVLRAKLAVEEQEVKTLLETVVLKDERIKELDERIKELEARDATLTTERNEARRLEAMYKKDYDIAKKEEKAMAERLAHVEQLLQKACQKNEEMHSEYRKRVEKVVGILAPEL